MKERIFYALVTIALMLSWHNSMLVRGYRPVIVMHGITAGPDSMKGLVGYITGAHPGTQVYNVDAYNYADSIFTPMWEQVDGVWSQIKPIVNNATDGIHLVCFSQGGLLCRAIIEKYTDNIKNFISLSSPQAGQFGDTDYLNWFFPNITKDLLWKLLYTDDFQEYISLANYWNDPHHQEQYHEYSNFLPFINNGSGSRTYKSNFEALQKLVLVGGPDDGVITPWQSSHFAFYDEFENILPMKYQEFFTKNYFGLQTLYNSNRTVMYSVSGVEHIHWHTNITVFDCCILPHLD